MSVPEDRRLRIVIPRMQGGPDTKEPGHVVLHDCALSDLVMLAYY